MAWIVDENGPRWVDYGTTNNEALNQFGTNFAGEGMSAYGSNLDQHWAAIQQQYGNDPRALYRAVSDAGALDPDQMQQYLQSKGVDPSIVAQARQWADAEKAANMGGSNFFKDIGDFGRSVFDFKDGPGPVALAALTAGAGSVLGGGSALGSASGGASAAGAGTAAEGAALGGGLASGAALGGEGAALGSGLSATAGGITGLTPGVATGAIGAGELGAGLGTAGAAGGTWGALSPGYFASESLYPVAGGLTAASGVAGSGTAAGLSGGGTAAAGAGGSALSRILAGNGSTQDFLSVGGAALPGLIGAYAANQQANTINGLAQQARADRAPYLQASTNYLQNPDAYFNGPGQTALNANLRALSSKFGNPIDSPTALGIASQAALSDWRNAVTGFGNLGLSGEDTRAQLGLAGAGADANVYNALGGAAADVINPPSTLEQLLRSYGRATRSGLA